MGRTDRTIFILALRHGFINFTIPMLWTYKGARHFGIYEAGRAGGGGLFPLLCVEINQSFARDEKPPF